MEYKYIFYFFNIIIAFGLLSYLKSDEIVNTSNDEYSGVSVINSTGYKWCFLIIHFISYLFLINFGLYKIEGKNSSTPATIAPNTSSETKFLKIIRDFKNANLDTCIGRLLFIFNLSTFNYLFPLAFLVEIIFFTIILWCIRTDDKKQVSGGLTNLSFFVIFFGIFKNLTDYQNEITSTYLLPIIVGTLMLFYFLQILLTIWNIVFDSECDIPGKCIPMKWIISSCNVIIGILSFWYLLKIKTSNNFCKILFGLKPN
jgi:hypothetical protein